MSLHPPPPIHHVPQLNEYSKSVAALLNTMPQTVGADNLLEQSRLYKKAGRMLVAEGVKGLVTTEIVQTRQLILEVNGLVTMANEVKRRQPGGGNRIFLYDGLMKGATGEDKGDRKELVCIDTKRNGNDTKYTRRSCVPNCVLKHVIGSNATLGIMIVATKEILRNQEVTLPFDADWRHSDVPLECAEHMKKLDMCPFESERKRYYTGQKRLKDAEKQRREAEKRRCLEKEVRKERASPTQQMYEEAVKKRLEEKKIEKKNREKAEKKKEANKEVAKAAAQSSTGTAPVASEGTKATPKIEPTSREERHIKQEQEEKRKEAAKVRRAPETTDVPAESSETLSETQLLKEIDFLRTKMSQEAGIPMKFRNEIIEKIESIFQRVSEESDYNQKRIKELRMISDLVGVFSPDNMKAVINDWSEKKPVIFHKWNCLSPILKMECIQRMKFKSRLNLRKCSRAERNLVDEMMFDYARIGINHHKMDEVVNRSQKYLLACIRYEFLRGKPVFETYKSLCKNLGNNAIEYKDFEFWFYRFSNGNFDLDYDRSLDPPTPYLSDMPITIIEQIVDNLEWKDRSIFRKTSKKYREIIDCRSQNYNEIIFRIYDWKTTLSVDGAEIEYHHHRDKCMVGFIDEEKKEVKGGDYVKIALDDLMIVFKSSEVHVENFIISIGTKNERIVEDAFKSLNHQINVKCFKMNMELKSEEKFDYNDSEEESEQAEIYKFGLEDEETEGERMKKQEKVMAVLPYLKPIILETIQIDSGFEHRKYSGMKIDKIVELEQWKQAKVLKMPKLLVSIPIHHYFHFNTLRTRIDSISSEDVVNLKDAYSNLPNFDDCVLDVKQRYDRDGVKQALGSSSFQLPDSNDKLDIRVGYTTILFQRFFCRF